MSRALGLGVTLIVVGTLMPDVFAALSQFLLTALEFATATLQNLAG